LKKFISYSCVGLAVLLSSGQALRAQQGFNTLETPGEAGIKAKAAAWLQEVGKNDAATLQQFEAIWKQKERTVVDRLGETFALANPAAAKLLAEARDPLCIPSARVPAILTDANQSVFFRANLGLAYARILSSRLAYDEGLDVLKLAKPEQTAEPAAYLFHRAVFEHSLLLKEESEKTINRLLTDALDAPKRYKDVSVLILADMQNWQDKDLGAVARMMRQVEQRPELAKAGNKTQGIQKDIIARLDELIQDLENQAGSGSGSGSGAPGQGDGEGQGQGDGQGQGQGNQEGDPNGNMNPMKGAKDSKIPSAPPGDGRVDQATIKRLTENWGSMPARDRDRELQRITQGMSPSHRQAIENYFRNIALEQRQPQSPPRP
jgi:hypothetical protein